MELTPDIKKIFHTKHVIKGSFHIQQNLELGSARMREYAERLQKIATAPSLPRSDK